MQLRFFGGAQEVGRTLYLLRDTSSLILDFGVKLSAEKPEYPIEVPEADAFILSHAHLDHCGAAPMIYKDQFIPAFGTQPTVEFSELLLEDSIGVARKEHIQPKFNKRQIRSFMSKYVPLGYGRTINLNEFEMTLHDAGHISGSAIVQLERKSKDNKSIVYTGDFKIEPQILHKGAKIVKSDVLITESTYAVRDHPPREQVMENLREQIKETIDNGGNVLLPTFAVGRSQELLSMLYKYGFIDMTYVDGMARAATKIALRHRTFLDNWDLLSSAAARATFVKSPEDRFEALNEPSVIVTTAGMLKGGPAMDYLKQLNTKSQVLITGYQVDGSNGHSLLQRGVVNINGRETKVDAKAKYFDLSAHAGKKDLYDYVKGSSPHTVICVHGDHEASLNMAENLKMEGYDAHAPKIGETINLD